MVDMDDMALIITVRTGSRWMGVGVWLSGEAGAVENKAHNVLHHYYYRLIKQGETIEVLLGSQ